MTPSGPAAATAAGRRHCARSITMTVRPSSTTTSLAEAAEAVEVIVGPRWQAGPGRGSVPRRPTRHGSSRPRSSSPPARSSAATTRLRRRCGSRWSTVDGRYREIRAEAYFDYPYEGPPTCVHGGVIAETFDEVLGAANMVAGHPGMTGTLTIRYRKPTPLRTPLRIEAPVPRAASGRKVRTWARHLPRRHD